jgi:hypothetical protein
VRKVSGFRQVVMKKHRARLRAELATEWSLTNVTMSWRSSVREEVQSLRILGACPNLANKPALHQSNKAHARGPWR